jgi:hypothetical protein
MLRSRMRFRQYRGRQTKFSCFTFPESFSTVPGRQVLFSCFALPNSISGGSVGSWSHFGQYRGRRVSFHILRTRTHFRRYRGCRVKISCFCAPGLILADNEGAGSHFNFLRYQTRFGRYRGRRVQISCFALPNSFSTVPMASGPVFMYCAPGLIFDGTEDVESSFHVLRSGTHSRRYGGRRVPFHVFCSRTRFGLFRGRQV